MSKYITDIEQERDAAIVEKDTAVKTDWKSTRLSLLLSLTGPLQPRGSVANPSEMLNSLPADQVISI